MKQTAPSGQRKGPSPVGLRYRIPMRGGVVENARDDLQGSWSLSGSLRILNATMRCQAAVLSADVAVALLGARNHDATNPVHVPNKPTPTVMSVAATIRPAAVTG